MLSCLLLAGQPLMANNKDELKQKVAEQLKKPVDYTDLPNLKLTFELIMVACLNTEDTLAWEKATKLVKDLNSYWQAAYKVVRKHPNKKRFKEKEKSLIQERLTVVNTVGSSLGVFGGQLERRLPIAISILDQAVEVGEKVFPNSLLLADAYGNLAKSYVDRKERPNRAFICYDKALEIKIACLGEQNLSTAKTYYAKGIAYFFFQEYDLAVLYFEKSLSIMLNCPLKETYSLIMKAYHILEQAYEMKGDDLSALKNCEEFLALLPNLPGPGSQFSFLTAKVEAAVKRIQKRLAKD